MDNQNLLSNEIIMVQEGAVDAFKNYMDYKVKSVEEDRGRFCLMENPVLWMKYPEPKEWNGWLFDDFYEMPFRNRKSYAFNGCMAIDVSNYINAVNSSRLKDLAQYMSQNKGIVFVLYAVEADLEKTRLLAQTLGSLLGLKKQCFRNHTAVAEPAFHATRTFGY